MGTNESKVVPEVEVFDENNQPYIEDPDGSGAPEALPRKVTDDWLFKEKLGSGAFSVVYRGIHKKTGQICAIKHINKLDIVRDEDREDLLEEVRVLQSIHHPNVMRIYGFYEDHKFYSLATEVAEGGELLERIMERDHYDERHARDLSREFIDTLSFLHANGVVHLDLKPENLLLASKDSDTHIKLADFGVAKNVFEHKLNDLVGTPDYMAPEVCILDEPRFKLADRSARPTYGRAADVWSAGVIIFLLLSGSLPFEGAEQEDLFEAIKAGAFELKPEQWDDVSLEARDLVRQMLTVDPKRRPTSEALCDHPWFMLPEEGLHFKPLSGAKAGIAKHFNAKRKWKGAIKAIIATQRMKKLFAYSHDGAAPGSFDAQGVGATAPKPAVEEGNDATRATSEASKGQDAQLYL